MLTAEEATWILLQSFGGEIRGEPFVCDLRFSDQIPAAARQFGATPIIERSGNGFVRAKMLICAVFGAEVGGRYFYGDLQGGDDALYTACRMIDYLSRDGRSLAELRRECPVVFITHDLRVLLSAEQSAAAVERILRGVVGSPSTGARRRADSFSRRLGLSAEFPGRARADGPLRVVELDESQPPRLAPCDARMRWAMVARASY